jgi:hypothetical protein
MTEKLIEEVLFEMMLGGRISKQEYINLILSI